MMEDTIRKQFTGTVMSKKRINSLYLLCFPCRFFFLSLGRKTSHDTCYSTIAWVGRCDSFLPFQWPHCTSNISLIKLPILKPSGKRSARKRQNRGNHKNVTECTWLEIKWILTHNKQCVLQTQKKSLSPQKKRVTVIPGACQC